MEVSMQNWDTKKRCIHTDINRSGYRNWSGELYSRKTGITGSGSRAKAIWRFHRENSRPSLAERHDRLFNASAWNKNFTDCRGITKQALGKTGAVNAWWCCHFNADAAPVRPTPETRSTRLKRYNPPKMNKTAWRAAINLNLHYYFLISSTSFTRHASGCRHAALAATRLA